MKSGLIIADSGPIFSLALIGQLSLLHSFFEEVKIPTAVWKEITLDTSQPYYEEIHAFFKDKVVNIKGFSELTFMMDSGESEAIILYKELKAELLLIDDKKARTIAENLGINCIGTLGVLIRAKEKGNIAELRPFFLEFLGKKRFYALQLLNEILQEYNEKPLIKKR